MHSRQRRRTAGDDWKWHYTTSEDVSDWANPIIQLRAESTSDSELLGSNVAVGGFKPNIFTTANGGIDSPATSFAAGVLAFYMLGDETSGIESSPFMEIQVEIDGAMQTVMPARLIPFKPALVSA